MTVVLIAGALTGIGRATALAFAKEGDEIVVSGRHGDAGAELVAELPSLGAEAEFICADVRHDEEMRRLIDQTVKRFGRLDVAVNNAGTEGHPGPVTEQTSESYAAVFDTNVLGTLLGMKHEMRVMGAQGGGSIVNLSSVLGKVGAPGAAVYTASPKISGGRTRSVAANLRRSCSSAWRATRNAKQSSRVMLSAKISHGTGSAGKPSPAIRLSIYLPES